MCSIYNKKINKVQAHALTKWVKKTNFGGHALDPFFLICILIYAFFMYLFKIIFYLYLNYTRSLFYFFLYSLFEIIISFYLFCQHLIFEDIILIYLYFFYV
jgi:uncharacterized membrane protein (DUF106 family)